MSLQPMQGGYTGLRICQTIFIPFLPLRCHTRSNARSNARKARLNARRATPIFRGTFSECPGSNPLTVFAVLRIRWDPAHGFRMSRCRCGLTSWLIHEVLGSRFGHEELNVRFPLDGPTRRQNALVAGLTSQFRLEERDHVLVHQLMCDRRRDGVSQHALAVIPIFLDGSRLIPSRQDCFGCVPGFGSIPVRPG